MYQSCKEITLFQEKLSVKNKYEYGKRQDRSWTIDKLRFINYRMALDTLKKKKEYIYEKMRKKST